MIPVLHGGGRGGGLDEIFFMLMISKNSSVKSQESTLIDNVHVERIYIFHPFCRELRIL